MTTLQLIITIIKNDLNHRRKVIFSNFNRKQLTFIIVEQNLKKCTKKNK